jgi:hypothetical protein
MIVRFNCDLTHKTNRKNTSHVSYCDIDNENYDDTTVPLFDSLTDDDIVNAQDTIYDYIDDEENESGNDSDDDIPGFAAAGSKRLIQSSDPNLPPAKRRKTADRGEYIIPVQEYEFINNFITKFVNDNKIKKTITWNESALAKLQQALNSLQNPIKDTIGVVCKKINAYIKVVELSTSQAPPSD